jgi:hypothetical protein
MKQIYASRKTMMMMMTMTMTTEFMPEHTPDSLTAKTDIHTKQNYSKGFESLNLLGITL